MFNILILAALTLAQNPAPATCVGAAPAIASVVNKGATQDGGSNRYQLAVTVVNRGTQPQAGNVLQSVDVYQHDTKRDAKGIPPLRPGQSYTYVYQFLRSADAGDGTTTLEFRLDMHQPAGLSSQDCDPSNDRFSI